MAADNLDRSVIAVIGYRLNDQGSIPDKSREPSDYPGRKQKVTACGVTRDEVQRLYRGVLYSGVPKGGGFGVFKPSPPEIPKIPVETFIAQTRRTGVSISFCSSLCSHTVVIY